MTAGLGSVVNMIDDDDEIMKAQDVRGPVYEPGTQEALEIAIKSPGTKLINNTLIKVQLNQNGIYDQMKISSKKSMR